MDATQPSSVKSVRAFRRFAPALAAAAFATSALATSGALDITASTKLKEDHAGVVTIAADGVTLNCNGHRISAPGADYALVITGRAGITVKNCRLTGASGGLIVSNSTDLVIKENVATGNLLQGMGFINMTDSTVKDNRASGNGGGEAFHFEFSSGNVVKDNTATNNAGTGYFVYGSDGNLFNENKASGNGGPGFFFLFSINNVVKENSACGQSTDLLVVYDEAVAGVNKFKENEFCTISQ